jgi:putative flippase GtrA
MPPSALNPADTTGASTMSLPRQFSIFFSIGLIATLIDYSTMIGLHELIGLPAVAASLCGYLLGGLISYTLNRKHTFQTDRSHAEAGLRFFAVMVCCFILTGVLMHVLVVPYIFARIGTTGTIFFINFTTHKLWTFAKVNDAPSDH